MIFTKPACANVCGHGLSVHEASTAVIEVANEMLGREWKSTTDSVTFDLDTIQEIRIVEGLKQIEAQEMQAKKDEGHMIKHTSESTTRRGWVRGGSVHWTGDPHRSEHCLPSTSAGH